MSEKRKIISKKGENEKDLNFIEDISSKIDKKSISVSVMRGKENSNLKEFYTQSLLNMKIDNKMKLTFETKIAFNYMKCFGFSKNKNSMRYKLNNLFYKFDYKISDYFDYLNVIRTMDEVELLKKLIFDKHELPLISVMRMPVIDLGPEFDIEKAKNLEAKNHFNEKITNEDMIVGVEKIMDSMHKNSSKKILAYLRDDHQEK
jgi:hypothetical protein